MPIAPRCPTSACPPHPYLLAPSLHIGHLPSHVREDQIRAVFQAEYPLATVCFARTKNGRNRGALRPRVDFPDLKSAERALATLHMRRIADTEPLIVLQFFITNNMKTLALPDASVSPRLIKVLPAGCTEETLFDLLRPYDPLYSVRIDPVSGGLVQFWTEANAKDAEIGLAATKTVLSAYDPCSLFCSNISFDLNAMVLRTHFEEFGHVIR
ncbi:hypothetical protein DFH07DRAFT_856062 [Mycena maculata]|uniref:RRM domain-containing protein n=1 Tax=Mycena maculata TaxID=230809 RepID=A0AAD7HL85_9AGAR|nr:hypothetical protein DFH07DRAFT_856062 [Mycena maculata]